MTLPRDMKPEIGAQSGGASSAQNTQPDSCEQSSSSPSPVAGGQYLAVAFLQNPWFPPGTLPEKILRYRDDQAYHQLVLRHSMSGARLGQAFGDLFCKIWWDNANWRPSEEPSGFVPPDTAHIVEVVRRVNPRIILTFGTRATRALSFLMSTYFRDNRTGLRLEEMHACHHPNARGKTQDDLNQFALRVRPLIT